MATALSQNLPDALKSIRTRPLFVLRLQVLPYYVVGATPGAFRRIGIVLGGLTDLNHPTLAVHHSESVGFVWTSNERGSP
jgi:hypothetical protein